MNRISRFEMWMQMAEVVAKRSTCYRGSVGAVVVYDRTILSIGYNGPPAGEVHCKGNSCERNSNGGCQRSIHAEINALNRIDPQDYYWKRNAPVLDIYVTDSPCIDCSSKIITNHVKRVFYRRPYRLREGIEELLEKRIEVYRMTPSGYIISELSGMIIEPEDLQ